MQIEPVVSIIVVSWNNADCLLLCLSSLNSQTYSNFEVILVDNGSTDASIADLPYHLLNFRFHIKKLNKNFGFAAANNIGVSFACGRWVVFLNADAFPRSDWIEKLLAYANQYLEYSAFSSCQLQYNRPHLLDGAGDAYHISGLAWRRYYNKQLKDCGNQMQEVFSACPAAALFSREKFLEVGGFDEDYFSYFEDVDLGFRLRLGGAKCLYVPGAVVYHVGSASTGKRSDFSVYYGYRNMIWTFVKNMPFPYLWIFLPLHVFTLIFFFIYLTARGQGSTISRAILDALRGLPKTLAKRKLIQQDIKIKPRDLLKVMSTGLLEPYLEFINRNRSE